MSEATHHVRVELKMACGCAAHCAEDLPEEFGAEDVTSIFIDALCTPLFSMLLTADEHERHGAERYTLEVKTMVGSASDAEEGN